MKAFYTGALDEFGNEYVLDCKHSFYNKDCSYCRDVVDIVDFGAHEGYGDCEDMGVAFHYGDPDEQLEAWIEMKAYYNKADYEPEYEGGDEYEQ